MAVSRYKPHMAVSNGSEDAEAVPLRFVRPIGMIEQILSTTEQHGRRLAHEPGVDALVQLEPCEGVFHRSSEQHMGSLQGSTRGNGCQSTERTPQVIKAGRARFNSSAGHLLPNKNEVGRVQSQSRHLRGGEPGTSLKLFYLLQEELMVG